MNTEEQDKFLRGLITMLGPDREVHAGKNFFLLLLDKAGPDGVLDFIKRAKRDLSEDGSLDIHYTFQHAEREIFRKAHLKYTHRAPLFGVIGWGIPGLYYFAESMVGLLNQFAPHERLQFVLSLFQDKSVYYSVNLVLGCALLNAAWEVAHSIKIEQISDAVSQISDKLPPEQPLQNNPTQPATIQQLDSATQYKLGQLLTALTKTPSTTPIMELLDEATKQSILKILLNLGEVVDAVKNLVERTNDLQQQAKTAA